jgi:phage/plasmid-like protein (TIGR03299 family)
MPADVETMFSAREVPWHGLGTVTDNVLTAKEAIVAAGLDWTVEKEQCMRNGKPVPNKFWNVRSSDDVAWGPVSAEFKNLQNVEAFEFADNIVDDSGAKYETAGALRGGRVVFMTMKLGKSILVAGEDKHDFYLVLRMGHDGAMAITVEVTPIRIVCTNTMKLAMRQAIQRWSIRHTTSMEGKLAAARESLKLSWNYADEFAALGDNLVDVKVTDDDLVKLLQDVMPNRPTTDERIAAVLDNFKNSPNIQNFTGTAWGALNAFTEFTDHGRETRSQEAIFHNIMNGEIATQRDKLTQGLLALA